MTTSHQAPDTPTRANTWRDNAACLGLDDTMYPDNDAALIERARAICRRCHVTEACLQQALDTEGAASAKSRWGVRAGLTGAQRRRIYDRGLTAAEALDPKRPATAESLRDAFERRTTVAAGGHLLWSGNSPVEHRGVRYTPGRIGFTLAHGRDPVGSVRRWCGMDGCVAGAHLSDRLMRQAARKQRTATA